MGFLKRGAAGPVGEYFMFTIRISRMLAAAAIAICFSACEVDSKHTRELSMKPLRTFLIALFICSTAVLNGCIKSDTTEARLVLNEDLSGELIINATNIASDHADLKDQRDEMRDFYKKDVSEVIKILREDGFRDVTFRIYNRTPLRCDGIIRAKFHHIMIALADVSSVNQPDAKCEFVRSADQFSVRISNSEFSKDPGEYFAVTYDKGIITHNAPEYDSASHTMRWNLKNAAKEGIYFVLQIPSSH